MSYQLPTFNEALLDGAGGQVTIDLSTPEPPQLSLISPAGIQDFDLEMGPDMDDIFNDPSWDIAFAKAEEAEVNKVKILSEVIIKPACVESTSGVAKTAFQPQSCQPSTSTCAKNEANVQSTSGSGVAKTAFQAQSCQPSTSTCAKNEANEQSTSGVAKTAFPSQTRPTSPVICSNKRKRSQTQVTTRGPSHAPIKPASSHLKKLLTNSSSQNRRGKTRRTIGGSKRMYEKPPQIEKPPHIEAAIDPEFAEVPLSPSQRDWLGDFHNEDHRDIMKKTYTLWRSLREDHKRYAREVRETASSMVEVEAEMESERELIRQAEKRIEEKNEHLAVLQMNFQVLQNNHRTCLSQLKHFKMFK